MSSDFGEVYFHEDDPAMFFDLDKLQEQVGLPPDDAVTHWVFKYGSAKKGEWWHNGKQWVQPIYDANPSLTASWLVATPRKWKKSTVTVEAYLTRAKSELGTMSVVMFQQLVIRDGRLVWWAKAVDLGVTAKLGACEPYRLIDVEVDGLPAPIDWREPNDG